MMRAQEKATGQRLSAQVKAAAIEKIEHKSTEQAEQTLLSLFPEAASQIRQERMTVVNESTARLAVIFQMRPSRTCKESKTCCRTACRKRALPR
jgi:hypothetical protein